MSALARFAGPLALLGGTVWVVAMVSQVIVPTSYAWLGLILAIVLMGGAALGLQAQLGARTGNLGRWSAVAAAAGSVSLIALLLIALALTGGNMATPPPSLVIGLTFAALLLWLVGTVVFALVLLRVKAVSPIAGWLIVLGATLGTVVLFAGGSNPSPPFFVPMTLCGVGWMLIGFEKRTFRTAELGVAGQAS